MRKIVALLALVCLPLLGTAQSAFDKFEDMNEVTSITVSEKAFQLFVKIQVDDPEAKQFMEMVKSLRGLRVLTTEDPKIAADMKLTVDKYLKTEKLEELMRVKDKDANINFYIREGKDSDHVKELLMYIDGLGNFNDGEGFKGRKVESVLLTLVGDIDLNMISELTSQMNLPSELNNAQKNK
ncbi:protein of unknown function [Pustulibacterium marinum]|uniref:DUF4252 domain-containing protein n=1 Tax=Pustulibacterium marinum TaxID=1224947 RepID=A0A1I7H529_9FLAO|nr:DUF4252 domain-containing protein [Pustulibacterium marinum]SFU55770.1 protein of unknown function [Pustulibacterium marinum]